MTPKTLFIASRTAALLIALSVPAAAQDLGKRAIELPVEKTLERAVEEPVAARADTAPDDNPRVAPGLVRWHADFAAARNASARSGKPVFLFQMLGRLDQEFC